MVSSLLLGTRKGLFRLAQTNGSRWEITDSWFLGDAVSIVLPMEDQRHIYAALDLGHFGVKLQRTIDGGASWGEITTPSFPPKPEGLEDKEPMGGAEVPWNVQLIWSLEVSGPDSLWCGVIPGALFHSPDGGENWDLVRSLWDDPRRKKWFGGGYDFPGIHSILVDPRDPRHITVGVSVGGVWTSYNSGREWELIGSGLRSTYMPPDLIHDALTQDPHRIVQSPSHPDRLWMQHHNGIFRSDDGGVTWRELEDVSPSSFGFAVAVHPTDPDTAWFVPAVKDEKRIPVDGQLVVTRTRDGGQTIEQLRNGLPEEPAYDLVYRHAMDISSDGQWLAFGSTTGSLWISADQGDHWETVSSHLPPILSMKFV